MISIVILATFLLLWFFLLHTDDKVLHRCALLIKMSCYAMSFTTSGESTTYLIIRHLVPAVKYYTEKEHSLKLLSDPRSKQ